VDTVLTVNSHPVKEKIRNIIKGHAFVSLNVDTLGDSADLYQAGMTSQGSVMLMLALESEFGLEFPDNMLRRSLFESVDTIAGAIGTLQDMAGI